MELTTELSLLTQQLRMWQMANEHHQRGRSQVWNPPMSMDHVRCGGTLYLNNNNVRWDHHSSTSWEERQDTFHSPHVQRSSLEETIVELAKTRAEMEDSKPQMAKSSLEKTMAELRIGQADWAMAKAESERSMTDMDNFQVA